jgi:hypothetical protein
LPALNRILAESTGRVCARVVADQQFFDALHTDAKTFQLLCTYARYVEILRGCEVALLALASFARRWRTSTVRRSRSPAPFPLAWDASGWYIQYVGCPPAGLHPPAIPAAAETSAHA